MINLKLETSVDKHKAIKTRKLVMTVSTAVLVGYMLIATGVISWIWYSGSKEKSVSNEQIELEKKVAALSESEVLARKLDSRVKQVNVFLGNTLSAASQAGMLKDDVVKVIGWSLDAALGKQEIQVAEKDETKLANYAKKLATRYQNVVVGPTVWDKASGWRTTISVAGDNWK